MYKDCSTIKRLLVLTYGEPMRIKDSSIGLQALKPQIVLALIIVDQVMQQYGQQAMITSINDATHSQTSLHYDGGAVDLRSKWFANPEAVLETCKQALGNIPDIDIILEAAGTDNEHFHMEYQPKRK